MISKLLPSLITLVISKHSLDPVDYQQIQVSPDWQPLEVINETGKLSILGIETSTKASYSLPIYILDSHESIPAYMTTYIDSVKNKSQVLRIFTSLPHEESF